MVLSLYEQYKKRQESKAEEKLKSLNEANEVYANYIKRFKLISCFVYCYNPVLWIVFF